ncbi:MAG: 50S ribosomal protein L30 [Bacillota bacterium]
MAKLQITLVKSPIGYPDKQRLTAEALGLRRMNQSVEHEDTPAIRGMIEKIAHLIKVVEI